MGKFAFHANSALTKVNLGSKVTTIGDNAFSACGKLTSVELGSSLKTIGSYAFSDTGLKTAVIPANVTKVGSHAFSFNFSLESIYVGSGVTAIPDGFCYSCAYLKNASIAAAKTIGIDAFQDCPKLTSVSLPSTVTKISSGAFLWGTTIYGSYGSSAQKYCQENDLTFIPKSLKQLSACSYNFSVPDTTFTGNAVKPTVTVKDGTKTLVKGTDYEVFYSHNVYPGTAVMSVFGKGNYIGCLTKTFTVKPLDLSSSKVKVTIPCASYMYRGRGIKPTVTVKYNGTKVSDAAYEIKFANNTYPGTADIIVSAKSGLSKNSYKRHFTVTKLNLADSNVKVTIPYASYMYRGRGVKPTVKVKLGSAVLPSTDYTVTFSNNTYPGTAGIKVTAKSKYLTGSRSRTFKVTKLDVSKCKATIPYASYTYSGSAIKPTVKLKLGTAVIPTSDYTVSYSNNVKVGTAGITVAAKSKYTTGKLSRTFTVKPGKIRKVNISTKGSKTTISWNKADQADGYEIYKATVKRSGDVGERKDYASKETYTAENLFKTVSGSSSTSFTFTLSDSNKDWCYAVRAYKKAGGKTYTGNFSYCSSPNGIVARINGAPKSSRRSSYYIVNSKGTKDVYNTYTMTQYSKNAIEAFARTHYTADTTDGEKVKIMLDYIRANFSYIRLNYGKASSKWPNFIAGAYAHNALVNKGGQCNDYNGAITELLNYLGYDARLLLSTIASNGRDPVQHQWTEITLDGTNYLIEGGITTYDNGVTTVVSFPYDITTYKDLPYYIVYNKNNKAATK